MRRLGIVADERPHADAFVLVSEGCLGGLVHERAALALADRAFADRLVARSGLGRVWGAGVAEAGLGVRVFGKVDVGLGLLEPREEGLAGPPGIVVVRRAVEDAD